jgi:hypothetical protein
VLSESRVAGQALVYCRNEQLQTGPAVAQDQEGMELEEGGHDEHQVGVLVVGCAGQLGGRRMLPLPILRLPSCSVAPAGRAMGPSSRKRVAL